ncbi:hypothetical protein BN7_5118 [Wickerhamomyces ciferrii]|uniref:C3H1-type domain-containing protein n=1 Tax=Wickerhamomyces ciferrii (strain ATCC 14091 / BCRC 22168 / CBS 111 / JCM 3599 / NBRC 0793 / NRRL Y-1031 F-60-10) TaxID=1206466 RepID=K0KQZ3_WICCF|nr:uncharacterized protein BN7_5118 [Wickerhamomyces ciferrii]CCH45536.1 hypothetical protein BN7_5118 [Wickerhamomyces ciferrii]
MSGGLSEEIARLRNAINQGRNQSQQKDLSNSAPYSAYPSTRGSGGFRGRGRGRGWARGRGTFPIRNRTLVVNNQVSDSEFVSTVSSNGRKLINKNIYDKELQEKNLSKEEKAAKLQDAKYKILIKKLEVRASKNRVKLDLCDRCLIDGDIYAISKYGARLVPTDIPTGIKPMKLQWNGYDYTRTKNGSLKLTDQKVGKACKFRHIYECPDYQLFRECPRGKHCKLTHLDQDNLDAKLLFNTLDPENFQLPNLTKLDNLHQDPRAQIRSDIEQNPANLYDSDSEDDDLDSISTSNAQNDALETNEDYITF